MQLLLGGIVGGIVALRFTMTWQAYPEQWWLFLLGAALLAGGAASLLGDHLWLGRGLFDNRIPEQTGLSRQISSSLMVLGIAGMITSCWLMLR